MKRRTREMGRGLYGVGADAENTADMLGPTSPVEFIGFTNPVLQPLTPMGNRGAREPCFGCSIGQQSLKNLNTESEFKTMKNVSLLWRGDIARLLRPARQVIHVVGFEMNGSK
jgi:hypothetical protein